MIVAVADRTSKRCAILSQRVLLAQLVIKPSLQGELESRALVLEVSRPRVTSFSVAVSSLVKVTTSSAKLAELVPAPRVLEEDL
eukprot:1736504-Pyramimonas_sp.AAC.1